MDLSLEHRREEGIDLPALVWRFAAPVRVASTAAHGGGIGVRHWAMNAQVPIGYNRVDIAAHIASIAATFDLAGPGVGLLTGADVAAYELAREDGAVVVATVGLGLPTWAAAPAEAVTTNVGTVNVVAHVPEALEDAALVNLVATITEAKVQALIDCNIDGSGTATDAVVALSPVGSRRDPFGGPRSRWGAPVARATYTAVVAGTSRWLAR